MLGKEEFEKSPAKNIHEPWVGLDDDDYFNIRELASDYHPNDPTFQERSVAWNSLDHLYHPLFDICISPKFKKHQNLKKSQVPEIQTFILKINLIIV